MNELLVMFKTRISNNALILFSVFFQINRSLIYIFFPVLLISCLSADGKNDQSVVDVIDDIKIEGVEISLDTMPQPGKINAGELKKVKPGDPNKIPAKQNKVANVDSQKILAGEPVSVSTTDPNYKHPKIITAVAKYVKAGLPERIEAKESYTIPENPFSFSFLTRSQGLPNDDINEVVKDTQGKLWFGTIGGGLVSYDGSHFNHYTEEDGLPGNHILSLFIDKDGHLWISARGGVARFDGKYFKTYTVTEGIYSNNVEYIYQDSKGDFWFCTFEGGVTHFDGEDFTNYDERHGLPGDPVQAVVEDDDEKKWFATSGGGIVSFDGKSFYSYTTNQGLISDYISTALKDSEGNLWFGSSNEGLTIFDGQYFYNLNKNTGLTSNHIITLYEDSRKNVWIGTRDEGLLKFDGDAYYYYKETEGMFSTHINDITEDLNERLWFATFGGGVGQYSGDIFRHYTEHEGLYDSFIRDILQDSNGDIWLASNLGGVFIYDGDTFLNYNNETGLPNNQIRALLKDSNDNIWMGFRDGNLVKYDGEFFKILNNDVLNSITTIFEDKNGSLWLGTLGSGVFKYEGDTLINYTKEQGLCGNQISKIYDDDQGNIWVSTWDGGISKFDGANFVNLTTKEGLPDNSILDIIIDSRGNLWAGSNGDGVFMYNDGRLVHFTEEHGLGSNYVYSVFEDQEGGLWFGTRMGLSKMLYSDSLSYERRQQLNGAYAHSHGIFFKNYTKSDGFLGIGCNSRAIFQDKDEKIWIGANDVLTVFNPEAGTSGVIKPQMHLTNIELFNENIPWQDIAENQDTTILLANGIEVKNFNFDEVGPWYGVPSDFELAHNNNYVLFYFSATNVGFLHSIRYKYMLEGLEENWNPFTKRTEAHYGNLPPGKYVFKIRAMNSEGFMSDELSYPITIKPPWWKTWWAYSIYTFLIILLIALLYKYRRNALQKKEKRRKNEWLMQKEVEVAKKSAEFKQNFLANMSHEIRTPLTGLIGMAELLKKTSLNDKQKDYLQTLLHSSENLKETINLVLDYSKIEAGKYTVNEVEFSMKELLDDAEKYFFSICKKDIKLKKFMEDEVPGYVKTDRNRVFQILSNLLSNAVKYTTKGKVGIHISLDKTIPSENVEGDNVFYIKISVSDTGKGISKDVQDKLFTPFYQVEQEYNRSYEGTGLGLAICKELTELLGGKIGLVSEADQGSTFWFNFPANVVEKVLKEGNSNKDVSDENNNQLKILFVEDKVATQKVVKLMLESLGHEVTIAKNGKQALEIYTSNTFDIILMDIQMPVMDGITATKQFRKKYTNLPAIVGLSANAFEGDREKYMKMGMDEYITKPVKEEDFLELLDKLGLKE